MEKQSEKCQSENPDWEKMKNGGMAELSYVIITPARNEARYIEGTIQSMIAQTMRPIQWVIVSDGSTDGTDEIVRRWQEKHDFIKLIRTEGCPQKNFSSKVQAIRAGIESLASDDYQYIGNLDADVTFPANYFANLLGQFQKDERLGLAGGIIQEYIDGHVKLIAYCLDSVAGAVQLFRSECFRQIGGYMPIDQGGEDTVAEVTARMRGWKVKTFADYPVFHHRKILSGQPGILTSCYNRGISNYLVGYHPLFHVFYSLYQINGSPYTLHTLFLLIGYFFALLRNVKRPVSEEFVRYLRHEQRQRIRCAIRIKAIQRQFQKIMRNKKCNTTC